MLTVILLAGAPGLVFAAMLAANFYGIRGADGEIGLRAGLIVLAPLLVSALSVVAVWGATNHWLLRWFSRMQAATRNFGAGAYSPPAMSGAPSEIATLADAFDYAVNQAREREVELAEALVINVRLTRELHHRVQNNLQILSSMISRQQRRTSDAALWWALSEVRARMIPIALAHHFVVPPALHSTIDTEAYLAELAHQLHTTLDGAGREVKLELNIDQGHKSVDKATNLGLLVAEAMVSGYAGASAKTPSVAVLTCTCLPEGASALTVGVKGAARPIDQTIAQQIARQLGGEVNFEPDGLLRLSLPGEGSDAVENPAECSVEKIIAPRGNPTPMSGISA
jgi:nitrate/nitrite-specific signal transduction histidine kinase